MGFREIQFDYVRFPTDGDVKNAVYPFATGQSKEDVILEFLEYAKAELEPYNVFISADVFGLTTLTLDDMGTVSYTHLGDVIAQRAKIISEWC